MTRQEGMQKILATGAAGAIIGGAATYAVTHQKQTKKALSKLAKVTGETVKRIDKKKVKAIGDVALSRVMKTKTIKKATNGTHKTIKHIPLKTRKSTSRRKTS